MLFFLNQIMITGMHGERNPTNQKAILDCKMDFTNNDAADLTIQQTKHK